VSLLEWLVNRALDVEIARGELPPAWVSGIGIAWILFAAGVLVWLWRRARAQKREERNRPAPESLLVSQGWLAEEGQEVPERRYRGRRRARREPRGRRPRQHLVPAHPVRAEVDATQVIALSGDDRDATLVIPMRGERRG
jgi:hypothetical protein